jgi:hypothetical protein
VFDDGVLPHELAFLVEEVKVAIEDNLQPVILAILGDDIGFDKSKLDGHGLVFVARYIVLEI